MIHIILYSQSIKTSYTSPEIQNELIDLLANNIKTAISEEVQNRPFSVIMDETSDISVHEQVAVIVRYADDFLKIKERFVGFVKTGSTTGKDLEEIFHSSIKDLGLSSKDYLVAQGYDGGSNMSGCKKGVAARVRNLIPRAYYIHCLCHRLTLSFGNLASYHLCVAECELWC